MKNKQKMVVEFFPTVAISMKVYKPKPFVFPRNLHLMGAGDTNIRFRGFTRKRSRS